MKYKKVFLTIVTIIGLNSCGGGADNTNETQTTVVEERTENLKTTVNNEAISFPKDSTQPSAPTEELSKN
jgi:hypothetical protein